MTRKDYELIARAFTKSQVSSYDLSEAQTQLIQYKRSVEAVSEALQADNPRFDSARFLKTCGV